MNKTRWARIACSLLALTSMFFVFRALTEHLYSDLIGLTGMTLIFIWQALNPAMMVDRIPVKEFFNKYSIEHSKAKYLAIFGILCIPIAFVVKALEWL